MTQRPALAAVVSALTGGDVLDVLSVERRGCLVTSSFSSRQRFRSWSHRTAAGALEALVARGLAPDHWCDPARAPRWSPLAECEHLGELDRPSMTEILCQCAVCRGETAPSSHHALVAVLSLGVDAVSRAEHIAVDGWGGVPVAWRMTGRDLREFSGTLLAGPRLHVADGPPPSATIDVNWTLLNSPRPIVVKGPGESPDGFADIADYYRHFGIDARPIIALHECGVDVLSGDSLGVMLGVRAP